ncbi:MAG: hypothetical protein R2821_00290 [Flavobacteriaceae bacterium]
MKALFSSSPIFMGILTLLLTVLIVWFIYISISYNKPAKNNESNRNKIKYLKSIGLFALVIGVLHQLIAWYNIIYEIEQAADINAAIVITALKTTMVPLIYGVLIYLLSLIFWFAINLFFVEKPTQ